MRRFFVDTAGKFSGGGSVVISNLRFAASRYDIFSTEFSADDILFIMRNVPKNLRVSRKFVLGPQNALPWSSEGRGLKERARTAGLRVASEYYGRHAIALFRTSSVIPELRPPEWCSPVLHNVLDEEFDASFEQSGRTSFGKASGQIVCVGSGHSYRNRIGLLRGYAQYRNRGGKLPLFVGGSAGPARVERKVAALARQIPGVTIHYGHIPRPQFLAVLREAAVVVLPSRVEASPLTALEACAATPRVVMSDIPGHREILEQYGSSQWSNSAFFELDDPGSLASALFSAQSGGAGIQWHEHLRTTDARHEARVNWAATLAEWLETIAERVNT